MSRRRHLKRMMNLVAAPLGAVPPAEPSADPAGEQVADASEAKVALAPQPVPVAEAQVEAPMTAGAAADVPPPVPLHPEAQPAAEVTASVPPPPEAQVAAEVTAPVPPPPEAQVAAEATAAAAEPASPASSVRPRSPGRAYEELWFALVRKSWKSIVLVPAGEGGSAGDIVRALAEVGKQLRDGMVTAIAEETLDYASAARIAGVVGAANQAGSRPADVIVAIPPVVVEPLGLAIVQAAEAIILCVERERTLLSSARRTIELVGRDRIAGSFLIG